MTIETGDEGDGGIDAEEVSCSGPEIFGTLSKPSPVLSCLVPCSVLAGGELTTVYYLGTDYAVSSQIVIRSSSLSDKTEQGTR